MHNYREGRELGHGNYGVAMLVTHVASGKTYVCKKVELAHRTEQKRLEAFNEVRVMSKLNHPNIVSFVEAFTEQNILHIVMEYADDDDLEKVMQQHIAAGTFIPQDRILEIFVQVALALRQLHKQHLLHRDLKPPNIFLTRQGKVKIGDFGFAKQLNYTLALANTICGTPYYFAPEVCQKLPYNNKADVWSLGVILYEMINLRKPFEARTFGELRKKVIEENIAPMVATHVSQEVKELCEMLLRKSSAARPTVEMILQVPCVRAHVQRLAAVAAQETSQARQALAAIEMAHPRDRPYVAVLPPVVPEAGGTRGVRMTADEMRQKRAAAAAGTLPACPSPPPMPQVDMHYKRFADVRERVGDTASAQDVQDAARHLEAVELGTQLQQDATEVLSAEELGDPQSEEERQLRIALGDDKFMEGLKLMLCIMSPAEPPASKEQYRRELAAIVVDPKLVKQLESVASFFEIDPTSWQPPEPGTAAA